ncbi:hypothetical protein L2E82_14696 [Cichorium intybus]|uniref:Uncharacterized protein n=1 Tax=Cichorium intybus TaxID=13427 RepID=A0ACB9F0U0_CICIN|nr:hypothetical protein L2E82_14696 [Cichorium intybus]
MDSPKNTTKSPPISRGRKKSERIMERTAFSKFTNNPSDPVLLDEDDSDFVHTIPKKISISKSKVSKKKVSGIPVVPLNISYEKRTKFKSDRPHKNVVVQYEDDSNNDIQKPEAIQ